MESIDWQEQKKKLKARLVVLTEADLSFAEEKKELMFNHVQQKLGKTREELVKIISSE